MASIHGSPSKVRFPLAILRRRVSQLCQQFVREFGQPQSRAAWIEAEKLAGQIMDCQPTRPNHSYDYEITVNGRSQRVEVKYSTIHFASKKWSFLKPLGESGRRDFDILLLIGLADNRFLSLYHCDAALTGLVFFAIPIAEAKSCCYRGIWAQIEVPTDPRNHRRKAVLLYRYQIGATELWRGRAFARLKTVTGRLSPPQNSH